ncbi:MAG: FAD:protein FMN transferase [Candidatus Delongbacteria bacterium]|nr:FAD:protein FMN transferase [Candidatus Cloacimonadota bacterium]MCA9787231.1 FAD:protein FMN transferase [Candidatus Cloacimonadota bacterium]MCB9473277.1 FAD:protein FMN transferase [Candidatus Delongbacteria bacterium]
MVRSPIRSGSMVLVLCSLLLACSGSRKASLDTTVAGYGLTIQVLGAEDNAAANQALAELESVAAEGFKGLSSTGDSDFAAINSLAGSRSGSMSQQNYDLLMRCFGYKKDTDEAFDFLIGPLRRAWGLGGTPRQPSEAELDSARTLVREGGTFVVDKGVLLSRAGMAIDLHEVQCGAIADRLALSVRGDGYNDFLLQLGSVSVAGAEGPDGGYFSVPFANPEDPSGQLGTFRLRNLSLAVASINDEAFELNGTRFHGHLDPATGKPAFGVLAVAVVCRQAERADALASGLFVMGAEAGLEKASSLDDVEAVFVVAGEGKPELRLTPGMEAWFQAR